VLKENGAPEFAEFIARRIELYRSVAVGAHFFLARYDKVGQRIRT
jgi:hypothetical protein